MELTRPFAPSGRTGGWSVVNPIINDQLLQVSLYASGHADNSNYCRAVARPMTEKADLGPCKVCRARGEDHPLVHEPGRIGCPECDSWTYVEEKEWQAVLLREAEDLWRNPRGVAYRPWGASTPLTGHGTLLQDAWLCISLNRCNAAIILLGASIEATLQEVLRVLRNEHFHGTLGSLIGYMRAEQIIDPLLVDYASHFASTIRNPWQHQKDAEIARGRTVKGKAISLEKGRMVESLLEHAEAIKRGEIEMDDLVADTNPVARLVARRSIDEELAYPLFNQVWYWNLLVHSRYLRNSNYAEMRRKFDVSIPLNIKWDEGRGRQPTKPRASPKIENLLKFLVEDEISRRQPGR